MIPLTADQLGLLFVQLDGWLKPGYYCLGEGGKNLGANLPLACFGLFLFNIFLVQSSCQVVEINSQQKKIANPTLNNSPYA